MATKERTTALGQDGGDRPALVTVHWVARYLGVSKARIFEMCREDLLPHTRLGRSLRFSPRQVIAWAESGGKGYPGGWRKGGV